MKNKHPITAMCKECKCKYLVNMENIPFIDTVVVGTCFNCLNDKEHCCYDELKEEYYFEEPAPLLKGKSKLTPKQHEVLIEILKEEKKKNRSCESMRNRLERKFWEDLGIGYLKA